MEEKIKEVLSKFPNGEERFNKSALFNQVVQALARDADVYGILDSLITITESANKASADALSKKPMVMKIQVVSEPIDAIERYDELIAEAQKEAETCEFEGINPYCMVAAYYMELKENELKRRANK